MFEITKKKESPQPFSLTLNIHESKIQAETFVTNIYELRRRSFAANVKQVAILCVFAWRKFSALLTTDEGSPLTELSK